jgi:hypothetical protein
MTKMQSYIELFGSGKKLYGGPGEATHKTFVKSACHKLPRYVPYKGTYVQYDGTYGTSNQGQTLDV